MLCLSFGNSFQLVIDTSKGQQMWFSFVNNDFSFLHWFLIGPPGDFLQPEVYLSKWPLQGIVAEFHFKYLKWN